MTLYLDSSAILKLIVKEAESTALSKYIKSSVITSAISRVEVIRTLSRNNQALVTPAAQVLAKFEFLPVSQAVLSIAESFVQSSLRSLDAIQVASVIFLSPKNNTLITYDKNMIKNNIDFDESKKWSILKNWISVYKDLYHTDSNIRMDYFNSKVEKLTEKLTKSYNNCILLIDKNLSVLSK